MQPQWNQVQCKQGIVRQASLAAGGGQLVRVCCLVNRIVLKRFEWSRRGVMKYMSTPQHSTQRAAWESANYYRIWFSSEKIAIQELLLYGARLLLCTSSALQ